MTLIGLEGVACSSVCDSRFENVGLSQAVSPTLLPLTDSKRGNRLRCYVPTGITLRIRVPTMPAGLLLSSNTLVQSQPYQCLLYTIFEASRASSLLVRVSCFQAYVHP